MKKMKEKKKEKKVKIKLLNNIYIIFLIIVLIIIIILSFKTGSKMYYLINTDLNDKDFPSKTDVAEWYFDVEVKY